MAQDFAKPFYNSARWKKCRAAFIAKRQAIDGGLCQMCRDSLGYIVHHITWLTPSNITNPDIALNDENFMYLCHFCHNKVEKEHDFLPTLGFDTYGNPFPV